MTWEWGDLKSRAEKALLGPLPGLAAQLTMVPDPRPGDRTYEQMEGLCLKAGILLLVFPLDGIPCLLFTRRTDRVLHHPGQISFPGGEQNPGETPEETAVRETEEELGIDLGGSRILGALTPLYIPPSNYCVYPFVALSENPLRFRPHPVEVAEVIAAPLGHLRDQRNRRTEIRTLQGGPVRIPFFDFRGNKIWGATAMVLAEFLAVLEEGGRDTNPPGLGR
jgi:8-oxo-dGTP pyrophosphatase MutT (NUDIX family)